MKARSGSYDNDPWGSARNSRSGSKETLNTTGYGTTVYNNTVNGCKDPPCPLMHLPRLFLALFIPASSLAAPSSVIPVQHEAALALRGAWHAGQRLRLGSLLKRGEQLLPNLGAPGSGSWSRSWWTSQATACADVSPTGSVRLFLFEDTLVTRRFWECLRLY